MAYYRVSFTTQGKWPSFEIESRYRFPLYRVGIKLTISSIARIAIITAVAVCEAKTETKFPVPGPVVRRVPEPSEGCASASEGQPARLMSPPTFSSEASES